MATRDFCRVGGLPFLLASAERELGAFMKAVSDSFGPKEARLAAEDWLEVLDSREQLPGRREDDWRLITIAAASRLATRLNAASMISRKAIAIPLEEESVVKCS